MWNRKVINPPPLCEIKTHLTDTEKDVMMTAKRMLAEQSTSEAVNDHIKMLNNEHYILSRFIYKINNQFRREKSLSSFQRINTCLKRLNEFDLINLLDGLKDCLDIESSMDVWEEELYVVSRQTLQYYLVKLMGVSALLAQTANYCTITFIHVMKHLNVGHMLSQNVILFAASSRIWYVTRSLCLKVCDWYSRVYKCLPLSPPTQVAWLSSSDIVPWDLMNWLTENGYWQTDSNTQTEMLKVVCKPAETPVNPAREDIGETVDRLFVSDGLCRQTVDVGVSQHVSNPATSIDSSTDTSKDLTQHVTTNTATLDTETYLHEAFKTFDDISEFQERLKSKSLDVSGTILTISKVKRKKLISIIDVTLDSIPHHLKKERKRKIFVKVAVPELRKILDKIVSSLT